MLEDNIKKLIKILEESSIDEIDISTLWGKNRFRLRKNNKSIINNNEIKERNTNIDPVSEFQVKKQSENESPGKIDNEPKKLESNKNELNDLYIKAPLVGTFYQSSKPGAPPFVKEGDVVEKGQVICIIEAMKIFNEIESEISGTVEEVLIEDGTPVEYDQNLMRLK